MARPFLWRMFIACSISAHVKNSLQQTGSGTPSHSRGVCWVNSFCYYTPSFGQGLSLKWMQLWCLHTQHSSVLYVGTEFLYGCLYCSLQTKNALCKKIWPCKPTPKNAKDRNVLVHLVSYLYLQISYSMQNTNPPFGPNFKSLSSITSSTWISSRISAYMNSVYCPYTMNTYRHLQDNQNAPQRDQDLLPVLHAWWSRSV